MSSELLLSNIIPFAGSGLVGYAVGFTLKKILCRFASSEWKNRITRVLCLNPKLV